jgi:hypothetical protein
MLSSATYRESLSFLSPTSLLDESSTSLILGLDKEAVAAIVVRRSGLTIGAIGQFLIICLSLP